MKDATHAKEGRGWERSTRRMLITLGLISLLSPVSTRADNTTSFEPAPAHALSDADEARWVAAVQNLKTDDGSTVLQALQYAQSLRPERFKFGEFSSVYNGATGDPDGVSVDYWIGQKRLEGDGFSIHFDVSDQGGKASAIVPKTQGAYTAAEKLMGGRDSLLRMIDQMYDDNCYDMNTDEKLC